MMLMVVVVMIMIIIIIGFECKRRTVWGDQQE
jgi:hypothetical protein